MTKIDIFSLGQKLREHMRSLPNILLFEDNMIVQAILMLNSLPFNPQPES